MSNIKDGGTAFPLAASEYGGNGPEWGMCMRKYFAAKAMQGLITTRHPHYSGEDGAEVLANDAYAIADAMLAAGDK